MPHDPAKVTTAEDYLEDLREMMITKVETGDIARSAYPRASERDQVRLVGLIDEGQEAERLIAAFAIARNHLDRTVSPQREHLPPRSNRRT